MPITPESANTMFEVRISGIAHDGAGVGFLPFQNNARGKAVFVPGGLPGQKLSCRVLADHKSFLQAEIIAILEENSELLPPHCPHWQNCGGCPLQRIPYSRQLYWKEKSAFETLSRIGKVPPAKLRAIWSKPLPSPKTRQYRNKAEFAFGYNAKREPALGFRKKNSHEVFAVNACAIIDDKAVNAAKIFNELAKESGLPVYDNSRAGFWRFFILRESSANTERNWLATCVTSPGDAEKRKIVQDAGQKLLEQTPFIQAFIHEERASRDFLHGNQRRVLVLDGDGKINPKSATLERKLNGISFSLDAANFFQINGAAAEILAQTAGQFMPKGELLLDLYAGVGAPGLLLGKDYQSITAMEADATAMKFAKKNSEKTDLNYKTMPGDAGKNLARLKKQTWDAALLDPPRTGLDKNALRALLWHTPERLLYISCNPATLGRDLNLMAANYEPLAMASVDLFPHTSHLECVCLLKKRA